jgi:hypothetical protein
MPEKLSILDSIGYIARNVKRITYSMYYVGQYDIGKTGWLHGLQPRFQRFLRISTAELTWTKAAVHGRSAKKCIRGYIIICRPSDRDKTLRAIRRFAA